MSSKPQVLIVGSKGRLGSALCRQLNANRDIIGLDYGPTSAESVDEHGFLHLLCDLRSESGLHDVLSEHVGHFDGLVYLPRIKRRQRFPDINVQDLSDEISLTVGGLIAVLRILVPGLQSNPTRLESVVVLSSALSSRVSPLEGIGYHVSKAALEQLVRVLAFDLSSIAVRVNAVKPTWVERTQDGEKSRSATFASALELVHNASPPPDYEDIGNVVDFLLSSRSRAMSGAILEVDKGAQNLESLYVAFSACGEEWRHA